MEAPLSLDGCTQVFEAPPVRAYRMVLKGNHKLVLKRNAPILVVGLTNAGAVKVRKKTFSKQGDFLFVEPSKKISLANLGEQEYTFAVLELK